MRSLALPAAPPAVRAESGRIDYRLARNAVLSEFRRGRLGRRDVCDAQPELLRAARAVGQPTVDPCPICAACAVVHVSYAFGPRLPPSGRLTTRSELPRLAHSVGALACYVVEVCPECSWNHLASTLLLDHSARRA